MRKAWLVVALILTALALGPRAQQGAPTFQKNTLASRISHTNPANYNPSASVHGGPGRLNYMGLFSAASGLDTNLYFLHRGIIEPKSGIGGHFHNYCEEMFVIFDGEAQFTIDGRTSTLKAPAGAPTRMGHWHAIYNPGDTPLQWMNINVSLYKGQYDAFDLGDGRVGAPLDPVPQFMSISLDPARLPVANMAGSRGEVKYRRVISPTVFLGPWGYLDQYSLAPGAATAPTTDREVGGFFYVISGQGKVTIGTETADIKEGDAVPIMLNDTKQFENTGTAPLQLMHVGIVSDMSRRNEILNAVGGARGLGAGGGPRGGGAGPARGAGQGAAPGAGAGGGRAGRGQ
jgi:mannose-6-phosphate isomerase-like protein (cupin superfamily)